MYIGRENDVLLRLFQTDGITPATGITYSDVEGYLWKQDMITWMPIGILDEEWLELGEGYYILKLRNTLVDRLGSVAIKIVGLTIATAIKEEVIEPLPPLFAVDASKCVVTGNIIDLTGEATPLKIEFSLISLPMKIGGVSLVSSNKIVTVPDAFGNFSVMLLCGTTVMVEIEQAGIKNQIVIPNTQTANLIDLLPPF